MILVTGAGGQLGQELKLVLPATAATFLGSGDLDITDPEACARCFRDTSVTTVINCAAYTHVDNAEDEREKAFATNAEVLRTLGRLSGKHGFQIIHISTDYVFDGRSSRPYSEEHVTSPVNAYGASKLEGERFLFQETERATVIRTSWLYSRYGKNFVSTMLKLAESKKQLNVVYDQIGCPTNAANLANAIVRILPQLGAKSPKLLHYSNEGVASWFDFAIAVFELWGRDVEVRPILSEQYPTKAKRPAFSVLDKSLIKSAFGIEVPYWRTSLRSLRETQKT